MTSQPQKPISIILNRQSRIEDCLDEALRTHKSPTTDSPIYYERLFHRDDPEADSPKSDPEPEKLQNCRGAVIEKLSQDFLKQTEKDKLGEHFIGMQIMYVKIVSVFGNSTYLILYSVIFSDIVN
jgi:hypothetical protein